MCFWRRVTFLFWISTQLHTAVSVRLHVLFNVKELIEKRPKSLCFCSLKYIKYWVWWLQQPSTLHYFTSLVLNIKENNHWPVLSLFMDLVLTLIAADVWLLSALSLFPSQTCHEFCICGSHDSGNKSHQTLTFIHKTLTEAFQTHQKTLEVEDHITTQSRLHSFSPSV